MSENPLITVIIPAHNSAKTIETAIRSILGQSYANLEVIVVDDNSTDQTKDVVESMAKTDSRLFYYRLPFDDPQRVNRRGRNINAGYMARNYGLEKAHGELITFQDADDASLRNRIDFQCRLLKKHDAMHVVLDWQAFDERFLGKALDGDRFLNDHPLMIGPKELSSIAYRSKGLLIKVFGKLHSKIDFEIKRTRIINKLFFGTLEAYPGTGNSPLFKREVAEKVKFRRLADRVWPSFMGRGADRDFNFQAAETFGKSYVFFVPLYMWRQDMQNEKYAGLIEKYIIG